ncbi:hypothetical protein [Halovivax gelatinilyticus]|uniref:hypothetical protein n=1 Tax=Halovivax gelatinilyticus TaxID=2961597 RepID=UPI0020CA84C6|nr:hypothetical protein [Halovivax gelatinilyticus]
MRRRSVLATTATVGLCSIAGCAGLLTDDVDLEFRRMTHPEPHVIDVETTDREYHATVNNRGDAGRIRAELWFFRDSTVPDPEVSSLFDASDIPGRTFDRADEFFFDDGERRSVTVISSDQTPEWDDREFGIYPVPATYGAIFTNSGATGDVEFSLSYVDPEPYSLTEPPVQRQTVGADQDVEVTFDVVIPSGVEYEIVAEAI